MMDKTAKSNSTSRTRKRQSDIKDSTKLRARPRLHTPTMLAAWPGIGNVAIIVANYLKRKLDFKELGEIEASHFFDPIGVVVRDSVVGEPQFPQSKFYYWKNKNGGDDIILFIGDDQPATKAYELANCVIELGMRFHVKRIYTCAAALTRIHHTEEPRVWGAATSRVLADGFKRYNLVQGGSLHISGLNGLLLGVAKEKGMDSVCLLGEVPLYATRIQNPVAALAVLEVLVKMLGVKIDMNELAQMALEMKEKMREVAAEAMGDYIDYFTEPIWERGEEEDEEED